MIRALRIFWWTFMEARSCAKVVHHRVELTVWITQRDRYRHLLAQARGAQHPFNPRDEAQSVRDSTN